MPMFKFYGRDGSGKPLDGERFAQSDQGLSQQLMKEGITPIHIKPQRDGLGHLKESRFFKRKKVTTNEMQLFARQMYTLTKAGVSIVSAIKHLAHNARNPYFSKVLQGVTERLESGQKIANALEAFPNVFSDLIVGMVRVGENSGHLDTAFLNLSDYLELEGETTKHFKSALRYPTMVLSAIVIGIVIINIFVVPTFARVYTDAGIPLPLMTKILIRISNFFVVYWLYLLIGFILLGVFFYRYLHTPEGKFQYDAALLKIPVLGGIIKRILLQRFMQTFAIIFNSGIPIIDGLKLVSETISNEFARQEILKIRSSIERGSSIVQSAYNCKLFGALEIQMFVVSEETGDLGGMLKEIALYYQREVAYDLKRLTDSVEPILLAAVAFMVLMLALAVYMPIWSMVKLAH